MGKIDWDTLKAGPAASTSTVAESNARDAHSDLVIGLIGQPNVGKSSLMNALLGSQRARASKTPGKTKHFQTHVLIDRSSTEHSRVLLCDCPGLVFPSMIGMEMQVLSAILPISQVQAAASCVEFAAHRLPLERVYRIEPTAEDAAARHPPPLTTLTILEALASRYNFKTAKAGRWDTNRAANLVLRAMAEGKIRWGYRPPGSVASTMHADDAGIWIEPSSTDAQEELDASVHEEEESEEDAGQPQVHFGQDTRVEYDALSDAESAEEVDTPPTNRFAALQME